MIQDTAWSPRFVASTTATAATSSDVNAGIDTNKFITPAALAGSSPTLTLTDVILGTSGASVKSSLSARAPRQGLVGDGTAPLVSIANLPAFGTGAWSVSVWVNIVANKNYNGIFGSATGGLWVFTTSSGALYAGKRGNFYNFGAFVDLGKATLLTITNDGTTATVYKNGISFGTSTTADIIGNYTSAISALGGSSESGSDPINGSVLEPLIYNRALSASEVVALYEAGAPSAGDYWLGGNAATTNNGKSTEGWVAIGSATINNSTSSAFFQDMNSSSYGDCVQFSEPRLIRVGGYVKISFQYRSTTAGRLAITGDLSQAYGDTVNDAYCWSEAADTSGAFVSRTATVLLKQFSSSYGGFRVFGSTTTVEVKNFVIQPLGLLLAPDAAQAGNNCLWTDLSGNGSHILLPATGVSWNVPSTGQTRIRASTSTNGNQKLLGGVITLANTYVVRARARSRTGTPTVNLSTYSNGQDIVANVALSTTWKTLTIIAGAEINAGTFWWAGSNSTDVVEWDIALEPLSY